MLKTYACPHFGQGAEAIDGQVTMRDAHGKVKTLPCARWADQTCTMCESEADPADESEKKPHDLHERGRTGGER